MKVKRLLAKALLLALLIIGLMAMAAPSAYACHKGRAHGQQTAVNVPVVEGEEPLLCGNFL